MQISTPPITIIALHLAILSSAAIVVSSNWSDGFLAVAVMSNWSDGFLAVAPVCCKKGGP